MKLNRARKKLAATLLVAVLFVGMWIFPQAANAQSAKKRWGQMSFSEIVSYLFDPIDQVAADTTYFFISKLYLDVDKVIENGLKIKLVDCVFEKASTKRQWQYEKLGQCMYRLHRASLRTDQVAGRVFARLQLPLASEPIETEIIWRPLEAGRFETIVRAAGQFFNSPDLVDDKSLIGKIQIRFPDGAKPQQLFGPATAQFLNPSKGDLHSIHVIFQPIRKNPDTKTFLHPFSIDVFQEKSDGPEWSIDSTTTLNYLRPQPRFGFTFDTQISAETLIELVDQDIATEGLR